MDYIFHSAEKLVPVNELFDLLSDNGKEIITVEQWENKIEYYKAMLKHYMYGDIPEGDFNVKGEVIFSEKVYYRKAIHEIVKITFDKSERVSFCAEITRPNDEKEHRVIVYIAFPNGRNYDFEEETLKRGYAIALFNYEQLAPDENITDTPIYKMFADKSDKVKAIGLWAFCAMRLIDYLDKTAYAKKNDYIITGHSRNGKAALCAGIFDNRISVTVPNNSGCGGCGCFRFLGARDSITNDSTKSETLERITTVFPHWFSDNMLRFYDKDRKQGEPFNTLLPFDLHLNKALIAPRCLLTLEAYGDEWANPYGSLLTYNASKKVFALYGKGENTEIQFREGGHAFGLDDFIKLLNFC